MAERRIALVALFAALIAALGLIPKLTLGFGVPITAQTLGVMLCGTVLGARLGGLSALLFVGLVAIGLPLLAGGRGGLGLFFGPSAGFLIGWPLAAFATGLVMEHVNTRRVLALSIAAAMLGGVVVLYIPGILGMAIALDLPVVEAGLLVLAFVPGDLVKAVIAGLITSYLVRARPDSVLSLQHRIGEDGGHG